MLDDLDVEHAVVGRGEVGGLSATHSAGERLDLKTIEVGRGDRFAAAGRQVEPGAGLAEKRLDEPDAVSDAETPNESSDGEQLILDAIHQFRSWDE